LWLQTVAWVAAMLYSIVLAKAVQLLDLRNSKVVGHPVQR
jgi:hypothetical protein